MSLKILGCECSGVEGTARDVLAGSGIANWMNVPLHKGKDHCKTVLDRFPTPFHSLVAYRALLDHIENNAAYAVILGYDDEFFFWEDVGSKAPIEVVRAQEIAKRFA